MKVGRTIIRLLRTLGVAKRAEQDPHAYRSNAGIAQGPSEMGELGAADAVWYCCAGHENTLVHFVGAHPFKYGMCYRCDHAVCRRCGTTASGLVRALSGGRSSYPAEKKDVEKKRAPRWCVVCPLCALSFRAARRELSLHPPDKCHCGCAFGPEWAQFVIGSVHGMRENPHRVALEAKDKWKMLQPVTYAARPGEEWAADSGRS
jgi:hypothetical protein